MKIIDPHVDVADFYKLNRWTVDEFFNEESKAWTTLPKLKQAEIDVIGFTLYFDKSFIETNFYDGVKSFYDFYKRIISKTDELQSIQTAIDFDEKPKDKIGYFLSIEGFECSFQ